MIKLNGHIAMDITFGHKTNKTIICMCVKIGASEQLLLGEGMCRQLGIVIHHGDVGIANSND